MTAADACNSIGSGVVFDNATYEPVFTATYDPGFNATYDPVFNATYDPAFNIRSPDGCFLVDLSVLSLHDVSRDFISRKSAFLFTKVKETVLMPVLFIFGMASNGLNVAVFVRLGLRQRINLCLFALALVEPVFVAYAFLKYAHRLRLDAFSANISAESSMVTSEAQFRLYGFYGFGWASMFVSAVIATERCLCVAWPLHSQNLLQTRTTALVLGLGVTIIVGAQFYVAGQYEFDCYRDLSSEKRFIQFKMKYFGDRAALYFFDSMILGIALPLFFILVVAVATVITATKLAQTTKFRHQSSARLSPKELTLTKMLVVLSTLFVLFNLPIGLVRALRPAFSEFSLSGEFSNTFEVTAGMCEVLLMVNSSSSFVVYMLVGSRYRSALYAMVGRQPVELYRELAVRCCCCCREKLPRTVSAYDENDTQLSEK